MKKLISALFVIVALLELSGCGIKGKLYIEPEFTQPEESTDGQNSKNDSDSEEQSEKNR